MHANTVWAMILTSMATVSRTAPARSLLSALQQATQRRHRCVCVLAGSSQWSHRQLLPLYEERQGLWLGEGVPDAIPATKARQALGSEYPFVVVDIACCGLHPDALAAVAGTVLAGGALFLLVPPLETWLSQADPDYVRLTSYPHDPTSLSRHFIARVLQQCVAAANASADSVLLVEERYGGSAAGVLTHAWPMPPLLMHRRGAPDAEQQVILQQWQASEHSAVLLARRGRGKSALLGFAAAQWRAQGKSVLLTAPARAAVSSVFRHAGSELPYMSPDAILADQTVQADVLLVDEAAGISLSVLADLLPRFPRVLFATTTDGYEGTGQGFLLRFLALLDACVPAWQRHTLHAPCRWAEADPVESWLDSLLLLNAQVGDINNTVIRATDVYCRALSQVALRDETLLGVVYGLLRQAHYRTTPDDLRFLLDGPDVSLYVAAADEQIVGVMLLVREGSMDAVMCEAIVAGKRRPRGHLLVQTLAVHAQLPQYLSMPVARVLRIAVHPALQRHGIGSALLQFALQDQYANGVKQVGSSFSATPEVLAFWHKNGFHVVRMGHRRQAASAAPSALVLHENGVLFR